VIVYVGAIAILFLFVVMMLDINTPTFSTNKSFFVATFLVFLFGSLLWFLYLNCHSPFIDPFIFRYFKTRCFSAFTIPNFGFDWPSLLQKPSDLSAISLVLYTHYFSSFLLSAYVLLVAMLGAISLTLKQKPHVRRQVVVVQNVRDFETLYKVTPKLSR
jgi:NADH-quinone oxidoreductase subunit J